MAACLSKHFGGLRVLLDGLVGTVVSLLQEGVTRNALRRLLNRSGAQKAVVYRQGFGFVTRVDEQIEQQAIVDRGPVGLLHTGVEIAKGLGGFLMLGSPLDDRQIGFYRILDTVFLEEAFRAL